MRYDLLKEFEELIHEENNSSREYSGIASERDEFLINSRTNGFDADINRETNEEEKTNEEDNSEEKSGSESDKEETGGEVSTPDESPSTINLSDALDFKKLKRDLNQFRASHSLSDPEVSEELEKYWERLSKHSKQVLHVFIKGLTQVTLLDVSGKTAYIPSDMKFKISKQGSATSEKLKSKARAQSLKDEKEIETATNTPIKLGESKQDKSEYYKILKENA